MKKYLLFAVALFSLFLVNTKAAQISSDSFGLTLDNNNLPYSFVLNNATKKMNVLLYSYESQKNYTYLVFDVCSTGGGFENLKVSNTAYTSYFNDNSAIGVWTGQSCTVGSYSGSLYKMQIQVGKFSDFDDAGELYAGSYLQFSFSGKYNAFYKFSDAYLSDVDVVTPLLNASNDSKKQQEIIDEQKKTNSKLDDVKSKQDQTNSKLDDIKNMDIDSSSKEKPDDTDYKDYEDAQGDLTDKISNVNTDNLDIGIDADSSNFIFDTMNKLINAHPAIFSMFIAILSIGIIKLGLGR